MDKTPGGNSEKNSYTYTPMDILTLIKDLASAALHKPDSPTGIGL